MIEKKRQHIFSVLQVGESQGDVCQVLLHGGDYGWDGGKGQAQVGGHFLQKVHIFTHTPTESKIITYFTKIYRFLQKFYVL